MDAARNQRCESAQYHPYFALPKSAHLLQLGGGLLLEDTPSIADPMLPYGDSRGQFQPEHPPGPSDAPGAAEQVSELVSLSSVGGRYSLYLGRPSPLYASTVLKCVWAFVCVRNS